MENDSGSAPTNADALDALARSCRVALLRYARSIVRDNHTAHDIVQDTFLTYLKKPPEPRAAKAWLFRVCRSRAIDFLRRKHPISFGKSGEDLEDFFERQPDRRPSPAENADTDETFDILAREIEKLTPRRQEIIRLKFQAGLSYKEIAETTGLTATNVGFILHDTLAALRTRLTANKLSS